jgi:hypothetical protein
VESVESKPLAVLIQMDHKNLLYERLSVNWWLSFSMQRMPGKKPKAQRPKSNGICVGTPNKT